MALTAYTPTVYINDQAPAQNATNLNKTEVGIEDVTDEVILNSAIIADLPTTYEAIDAAIMRTDVVEVVSVAHKHDMGAFVFGASVALDMNTYSSFSTTLTANFTLANPTNITAGEIQSGLIKLTQDATGGRTLTLGTSWTFINTDGTTTVAGDINVYRYTVIDDTHIFLEFLDTI